MGFRTVVILSNDDAHTWKKDPKLGEKIVAAWHRKDGEEHFEYGEVTEVVHADTQSLMLIDSLSGTALVSDRWVPDETDEQIELKMLTQLASKLGYSLNKMTEQND